MDIKNNFKSSNTFYILILLGIAFLVMLPMFIEPYHALDDTKFHVANIEVMKEQILAGNIIINPILAKIGYGLGYGTGLFYPPLAHLVMALVAALFSNTLLAMKLVHFLVLFLSGVTTYFLAYHLTKKKHVAFFSAIIYMLFPYHLSDIYVRDAQAECFIFIFTPMILLGLCYLLENDKRKFYPLFIIGYVGAILSHFTLTIYLTILLICFLIPSRKKIFTKQFLIPFLIASLCVMGLTLPFLINLIQNYMVGDYVVFNSNEMAKRIWKTALIPFEYVNIFFFLQNDIKKNLSLIILILLSLTIIKRKQLTFFPYISNFLIFGIVAFILSTKIFPWLVMPSFIKMIQFPWRLEIFVGITVSLFAPICLQNISFEKLIFLIFLFIFSSFIVIIPNLKGKVIDINNIWYNGGMGWQKEYLPIKAKENIIYLKHKKNRIDITNGIGTVKLLDDMVPYLKFNLECSTTCTLELPRIYYPGYTLKNITTNNRLSLEMSDNGLIQASGTSGIYILEYKGSNWFRISIIISLITFITSVLLYTKLLLKRDY